MSPTPTCSYSSSRSRWASASCRACSRRAAPCGSTPSRCFGRHREMLRLTHVSRFYTVGDSQVVALDDVTLTITEGDYVAVVGPYGSGKSTLLQLVGLLDRPTHGTVELDGVDVGAMTDAERTRVRLH